MAKIIAIALQKGGVGKTTTAQHLAHALAMRGRKVLLVDLDQQGSTSGRYDTSAFNGSMADVIGADGPPTLTMQDIIVTTHQDNLWLAPASERLEQSDERLSRDVEGPFMLDDLLRGRELNYDYIIVDTAPGKSALLIAALVAADEVILPVQLSPMGFDGYRAIDRTIEKARRLQSRMLGSVRLRLRAVVPTFYSRGQIASDGLYGLLAESEHPDYEDQRLPLSPPVVQTTSFELASQPVRVDGVIRARTIFEMPRGDDDSPTARGQDAYYQLAEMVDSYV